MNDLPALSRVAKAKKWWRERRVSQKIESLAPVVFAVAAFVGVWRAGLTEEQVGKLVSDVLPTAVTVATVLAGFQATAQSVLIALIDSPAWKYLQRLKHDHRLVNYHWETIASLLIFIGLSLGVLIAKALGLAVENSTLWVPGLLGATLVHSGACSIRIAHLMVVLLKQKDTQSPA